MIPYGAMSIFVIIGFLIFFSLYVIFCRAKNNRKNYATWKNRVVRSAGVFAYSSIAAIVGMYVLYFLFKQNVRTGDIYQIVRIGFEFGGACACLFFYELHISHKLGR